MSKKKTTAVGATVLSALVAGGVAFTPVATAQEPVQDSAFALGAEGLLNVSKIPHVQGEGKDHLVYTELPPGDQAILSAGVFNAAADDGFASASTADVGVNLPAAPLINASLIKAECVDGEARTSLVDLQVGNEKIAIDQLKPNTEIIPDPLQGIARLTLNKQESNDDGSTTVTAIAIDLLNSTQTLDISQATCAVSDEGGDEDPTDPTDPGDGDDGNGDDGDDGDNGGDDGDNGDNGGDDGNNGGDDGDNGDNGADDGDEAGEDGKAPKPTPQPGNLEVTG